MDIDDILLKPEFKKLDDYLTKEMERLAGDEMMNDMLNIWKGRNEVRNFFYRKNYSRLGGRRPYDWCKEGKKERVEKYISELQTDFTCL